MDLDYAKIGFLFLVFAIISGGYVTQVLSCQIQRFLSNSLLGKHIIGFLLAFVFIMMEGGWSFDQETQNKAPVDWSNGNVLDSMVFALGLYLVFFATAKMKLRSNILLYITLFILYLINTQRNYWLNREMISHERNEQLKRYNTYLFYTASIIFVFGILEYYIYKKQHYKDKFSFFKFLYGKNKCTKL